VSREPHVTGIIPTTSNKRKPSTIGIAVSFNRSTSGGPHGGF
jgi:hypothetical protein